jgi:GNAT superfamily N-acetyltransferase
MIQPATPIDSDLILNYSRALNEEDPDFTGKTHFDEPAVRAALTQLLVNPALGRAWLIVADGTTVGYIVLTFGFSLESHGRDGFIDELYLAPEWRRQGFGAAAVELVSAEAQRLGLQKLYLEVERPNNDARRFYRRLGFADHNRFLLSRRLK